MKIQWKSSVLRCDACDDGCPVCRFLAGDKTKWNLMAVIAILDAVLAKHENQKEALIQALSKAK